MRKNYCATLIRAYASFLSNLVLVRLSRSGPAIIVAGRCERAQQCCAKPALALMYFLHTLRFLRSGRTRLKTARDVLQLPVARSVLG